MDSTASDRKMVGREGIEPSTNGLKVHCSTAELTAPLQSITLSAQRDDHSPFPLAGEAAVGRARSAGVRGHTAKTSQRVPPPPLATPVRESEPLILTAHAHQA